jgi:hypothetical protein
VGGASIDIPKTNYVYPIRPEDENAYSKAQAALADKILGELNTKEIKPPPNIIFYETIKICCFRIIY